NTFGSVATNNTGISHFVISFAYTWIQYAFYWDGAGDATFRVGQDPTARPVGNSWNEAAGGPWAGTMLSPIAVNPNMFNGASNQDNAVTAYLLPNYLVEILT
ncbi:hypothetical protein M422DRAFT_184867, partial [Sphaerobolus stellatus SS14]